MASLQSTPYKSRLCLSLATCASLSHDMNRLEFGLVSSLEFFVIPHGLHTQCNLLALSIPPSSSLLSSPTLQSIPHPINEHIFLPLPPPPPSNLFVLSLSLPLPRSSPQYGVIMTPKHKSCRWRERPNEPLLLLYLCPI